MTAYLTASWQENNTTQQAVWHSEANQPVPKRIVIATDATKADEAYKLACEGSALLYRGDFQNAKQLLQAITRRVDRKPVKPAANLTEAFHQHRARQIQRANITNKLLIELQYANCPLKRAPEVRGAVSEALIIDEKRDKVPTHLLLSLKELLGMIGAHEWHKKGVYIDALQAYIHPSYGVYSPVRGEYLTLINQLPLHNPTVAFDIGTGTGVVAAILVHRGVKKVIATDNSPRALQCARANIEQLEMAPYVEIQLQDMFPSGKADLIVCNPPWIPAKANAPIEHAVYDPDSRMLKAFLSGVNAHLNAGGEAWLVMSDLAEHLGLRTAGQLQQWVAEAGLLIVDQVTIAPRHAKAGNQSDPLYPARSKEITSVYRLKPNH